MRKIFILIPSFSPSGPVKGAIALANSFAVKNDVTLVALKQGVGADAALNSKIRRLCLSNLASGLAGRVNEYRKMLKCSGGRKAVASISMCFSADMANMLCRREAIVCSSVRGNLIKNYKMDYGQIGIVLALTHLICLNCFDHVVVMTSAMAKQVKRYIFKKPVIIGNFVNEKALDEYRVAKEKKGPIRFIFLGTLSRRKQPIVLLKALAILHQKRNDIRLDVIGSGPLMEKAKYICEQFGIQSIVIFHGQLKNPYNIISRADCLVLPSISEGISRAALESLYLNTPCVLRRVDGNHELIKNGINGFLFEKEDELPDAMLKAAELSRRNCKKISNLLPNAFRQDVAYKRYFDLFTQLSGMD